MTGASSDAPVASYIQKNPGIVDQTIPGFSEKKRGKKMKR